MLTFHLLSDFSKLETKLSKEAICILCRKT